MKRATKTITAIAASLCLGFIGYGFAQGPDDAPNQDAQNNAGYAAPAPWTRGAGPQQGNYQQGRRGYWQQGAGMQGQQNCAPGMQCPQGFGPGMQGQPPQGFGPGMQGQQGFGPGMQGQGFGPGMGGQGFAPPRMQRPGFAPGMGGWGQGRGQRGQQGGPHFGERACFWDDEELVDAIGLTDEQVNLLQKSYDETEKALEGFEDETPADYHNAIKEALDADAPDLAEVNAAIDAMTDSQNAKMKALLGHRVVVKNVLTEEQEQELQDYRRDRVRDNRDQMRQAIREVRDLVRDLAKDGLSEEDQAEIDAALEDLEPQVRERVENRLERIEQRLQGGAPAAPRFQQQNNWQQGDNPQAPGAPEAPRRNRR